MCMNLRMIHNNKKHTKCHVNVSLSCMYMKRAKAQPYLLKSIQMRKFQYFGRSSKITKTVEGTRKRARPEEVVDQRGARTD